MMQVTFNFKESKKYKIINNLFQMGGVLPIPL